MDRLTPAQRSRVMSRIRGVDTKPEVRLRSAVHALGGRFRKHDRRLPGRPDLSNRRAKLAVFVDGCFWHGCPKHYSAPQSRRQFWSQKLARVKRQRKEALQALTSMGFSVLEIWECEANARPWAQMIAAALGGSQFVELALADAQPVMQVL